jgi:hypothetical protein
MLKCLKREIIPWTAAPAREHMAPRRAHSPTGQNGRSVTGREGSGGAMTDNAFLFTHPPGCLGLARKCRPNRPFWFILGNFVPARRREKKRPPFPQGKPRRAERRRRRRGALPWLAQLSGTPPRRSRRGAPLPRAESRRPSSHPTRNSEKETKESGVATRRRPKRGPALADGALAAAPAQPQPGDRDRRKPHDRVPATSKGRSVPRSM